MKIAESHRRIASMLADRRWYRVTNTVLSIILLGLMFLLFQKKEHVIIIPPQLDERINVSLNLADSKYKKAWAKYIATLAGNITPSNVEFVADSIGELLAPEVHHKVAGEFGSHVYKIRKEGIRTAYAPKRIEYDENLDRVFVVGDYSVMLPTMTAKKGEEYSNVRRDKVYELSIEMSNGVPMVKHFETYFGEAHDTRYYTTQEKMKTKG
jgi:conjugal transfer pilus assembly protein TraE